MSKIILLNNKIFEQYQENPENITTAIALLASRMDVSNFEMYNATSICFNLYGRIATKREKGKFLNCIKNFIQDDFIKIDSNKNSLLLDIESLTDPQDFIPINIRHVAQIYRSNECKAKDKVLLTYVFLLKHFDRTANLKGSKFFNKFYYLGQDYMASVLNTSPRSIRKYLKELEFLKIISSLGFYKPNGSGKKSRSLNIYSLYENKNLITDFAQTKGLIPNDSNINEVNQHRKLIQIYNRIKNGYKGNYAPSVLAELVAYLSSKDSAPPLDPIINYCSEHKIDMSPYLYDYDIGHPMLSLFSANP